MIKEAISSLVAGDLLGFAQAVVVMEEIMNGEATPAQFAAFVTALRLKGETAEEIAGMASVMRAKAVPVVVTPPVVDTCGTGGDSSATVNISTAAALVAAGAGIKVAKHGNRAMSSRCGSADVLEALGVMINLGADAVAECIEKVGIGFMFAPVFHPAMKYVAAPRREIGIRTVFNILGPLTNPARAEYQVIGVAIEELGPKMAQVLHRLGINHALVVHGRDGMDELSINSASLVWEVNQDRVMAPYEVSPGDFGFNRAAPAEIRGGAPEANADILRRILDGHRGPQRDVVVMNAAAALYAGEVAINLEQGARLAEQAIDSGRARQILGQLVKLSQELGQSD